jgi:hypothetical protein
MNATVGFLLVACMCATTKGVAVLYNPMCDHVFQEMTGIAPTHTHLKNSTTTKQILTLIPSPEEKVLCGITNHYWGCRRLSSVLNTVTPACAFMECFKEVPDAVIAAYNMCTLNLVSCIFLFGHARCRYEHERNKLMNAVTLVDVMKAADTRSTITTKNMTNAITMFKQTHTKSGDAYGNSKHEHFSKSYDNNLRRIRAIIKHDPHPNIYDVVLSRFLSKYH